jgi:HTH-type transcriptional regulator / antitoxin HigA
MTEHQFTPDWFSKPGDSLRALMQRRGIAAQQLAEKLNGGASTVRGLLSGSVAIDAKRAKFLSEHVGGGVDFWLKRQANYDAALDRAVSAAECDADLWFTRVPSVNPHPRSQNEAERREHLRKRLAFFNVATIRAWEARYGRLLSDTRFRTTETFASSKVAVLLWLRHGELEADMTLTRPWKPANLRDRVDAIRKLSKISHPARFIPKLRQLCAEAGVAVVVIKAPKGCYASGASTLVAPDKAMVLLSFRYRADDQFWFTVFHEVGHLLLHGARTFVDDRNTPNSESEQEANEFARSCIIPDSRMAEFESLRGERNAVLRFSVSVGVAPGLTVGQLQRRQIIKHHSLNSLKRYWTWDEISPALA